LDQFFRGPRRPAGFRTRGMRVVGLPRIMAVMKRTPDGMEPVELTDELRAELSQRAFDDLGALLGLIQAMYGVVIHKDDDDEHFAYHWHTEEGQCMANESMHGGYEGMPMALLAAIEEMLQIERLNGLAPLVVALSQNGIDLTGLVQSVNNEEDQGKRAAQFARVIGVVLEQYREGARIQPSGFAGPLVGSLLMLLREIVTHTSKDAHAAVGETQMPIPAMLPAGHVAVPALAVLSLETVLQEINANGGPTENEYQPHIARTA